MTILEKILQEKEQELPGLVEEQSEWISMERVIRPSLLEQIKNATHLQVISEIKRASPSKGVIQVDVNPAKQAKVYEQAGAACVSVLTDATFFKGSFQDLTEVAEAVRIPVLCKDFIIHPIQIDRAVAAGASVILLIVAALTNEDLRALHLYATSKGLEVLVEVHDVEELDRAIVVDAQLIGVNNRDLRTFQVDLKQTEEIASVFPFDSGRVLISESGISSVADVERVAKAGAGAVLVGETLMRSDTPDRAIRSLQVKREVKKV